MLRTVSRVQRMIHVKDCIEGSKDDQWCAIKKEIQPFHTQPWMCIKNGSLA